MILYLKKIDYPLTNFIVYDHETYNRDRPRPYNISLYRLSKKAAKHNRDLTQQGLDKCERDTNVFEGDSYISKALD